MAHDNETNTLELHIKVNGQNLSATSEKCNIGTLRIPSDPSWPKIPSRRLSNNTDDIIEPSRVVTLTGTSRKGCSMMQTVACQHLKSRLSQKYEAPTHIAKRLPGCFDPRFRRQILQQKAEKPDEFCNTNNDKQVPELDTHISQEIKKLEGKSWETNKNVDGCVTPCNDVDNLSSSVRKSTKNPANEQSILEAKHCPSSNSLQHATNERYDMGNGFSQEEKQESNRSLLLMVDEKKIQALPINTFNAEAVSSPARSLQCFSVQIPVVAYSHEVPLQISSMPTQTEKDVKMSVCENEAVGMRKTVGSICTRSTTNSMCSFKESRNEKYPLDNIGRCCAKNSDNICISKNKSIPKHGDEHTSGRICDKENVDSNVSLNQVESSTNEIKHGKVHYGNSDALDDANTNGGSHSSLDTAARSKSFAGQNCAVDSSFIADACKERKVTSERKMTKTRVHSRANTRRQKLAYRAKNDRDNADNPSANVMMANDKMMEGGMQSLASSQVCEKGKEHGKGNEENESVRERGGDGGQRINAKRKTAPVNLSRKAKSFLRKKSRLAITDSDCTLILPGYRCVKGKRYEKRPYGRSKVKLSLHGRNGINNMNSILVRYNASKQGRINSRLLTNLRAGNSFEKPSSIPLETRQLLNKSYWEYYWKLRKIAGSSTKPGNAAGGREMNECWNEEHLPETQTLRQCSVLSCMINTALRDSTTAGGGPSSDPVANVTADVHESAYQVGELRASSVFARKIKQRRMKRASKWLLGLRAIALLCIAMYVAVIFLPMMYDYFLAEEYDDGNANYIELTFRYIASSFGEALDGVIDVLATILLRPARFDRKQ